MASRTLIALFGFFLINSPYLSQAQESVPGELIVTYKSSRVSSKTLAKTSLNHNLTLKNSWSGLKTYHFKVRSRGDEARRIEELKKDPNILSVEPNYIVKAQSLFDMPSTSEEIYIDESWTSVSDSQESQNIRGGGSYRPIVAVIDSGLDTQHEVFRNSERLWTNEGEIEGNGIDDDGNGFIDDVHGWNFVNNSNNIFDDDNVGHGTHVAGIVSSSAGPLNENQDVNLESLPPVRVMALKFLNGQGEGTTSDAISAIYYAIQNGAKVLNNSWGGPNYSTALHQAVNYTYENDAVFVAASGNNGIDTDAFPLYPASLDVPNVISVGASQGGRRAYFSNYGVETVHIFAPGVNIYSSWPLDEYGRLSGTSMSAPYVSALAALMSIEAPHFSGFQIRRDMMASGESFEQLRNSSQSDKRIDFESAVLQTQSNAGEANFKPDYSPNFGSRGIASTDSLSSGGTGCGMVKRLSEENKTQKNIPVVVFLIVLPLILSLFYRDRSSKFVD